MCNFAGKLERRPRPRACEGIGLFAWAVILSSLVRGIESTMAEALVVRPDRRQLRWDMIDLEGLLPADHRVRLVWSFVESLDLSPLYDQVLAREGEAGRTAADRAVLLSLWLYATSEAWGRRGNWSDWPKATPPIAGWRAACR
jgi:hypothetical protein